jgi:urease accessory protein
MGMVTITTMITTTPMITTITVTTTMTTTNGSRPSPRSRGERDATPSSQSVAPLPPGHYPAGPSVHLELAALQNLFHLASPALPIGTFAHSQGLEQAVELGWVTDEASAADWIHGLLVRALGTLDAPIFFRLHQAYSSDDPVTVRHWNDFLYAARGTRELQDEDRRVGGALARALVTLGLADAGPWATDSRVSYPTPLALASARWNIPADAAVSALLFSWAENQAAAAMRLVPLGQSSGLRLVSRAAALIPEIIRQARTLTDDDLGGGAPGLGIASALHETQYSRIFRS